MYYVLCIKYLQELIIYINKPFYTEYNLKIKYNNYLMNLHQINKKGY